MKYQFQNCQNHAVYDLSVLPYNGKESMHLSQAFKFEKIQRKKISIRIWEIFFEENFSEEETRNQEIIKRIKKKNKTGLISTNLLHCKANFKKKNFK